MTVGRLRLGNKRSGSDFKPEIDEIVVNIDRPNILGNDYTIGQWRTRAQAIDSYRVDLEKEMRRGAGPRYSAIRDIVETLKVGQDVILMCWCHPLPCHGLVIKEVIERILESESRPMP